jgi:AGCS family alanine or glycine:cation symporter
MMIKLKFLDQIDLLFSDLVNLIEKVFFVSIGGIPLIILWLIAGGIFCTIRMGFINLRGFKHALTIARGKDETSSPEIAGEVSAFQALATALSGSVGLGNIAGVAIAISLGGPGAVFWMTLSAFLGMSIKFVESTLGLKYRTIQPDGTISGGPMYYLACGLAELGFTKLGQGLAVLFALFSIPAALGGGNMFQVNQSFAALTVAIPGLKNYDWLFGLIVAFVVGLVIIGGISRISIVTSKLLPLMICIYLSACIWVLGVNFTAIPQAFHMIIDSAFSPHAVEGGITGVLIQGIRRSVFSNGAGLGVAAIAHAVARTEDPIREGIVAILEPFIDTVIICNLTALVILTTGTYGENMAQITSGSALASRAFASVIDWLPVVLAIIMFMFGFSTMITWSYYGERCWAYLIGEPSVFVFKGLFLICIFLGSIVNLGAVVDFSDMMMLAMAVPNLFGCVLLSSQVAHDLKNYWQDLSVKSK